MALVIPTTAETVASVLSRLESAIGQTSPTAPKAFLRVLSSVLGLLLTGLYKYAGERTKQNLAMTATGDDLDLIGTNYGVTRRAGVAAVVELSTTGTNGTDVTPLLTYVSDFSGVRYFPTETVTIAAGVATFEAIAEIAGEAGNLTAGDTLTIESSTAGLSSVATYSSTTTSGTDREDDPTYRRRVLNEIRTVGGGGNSADYRTWAEEVAGVQAAYPYAGRPASEGTDQPGDRTVYVEATTDVDPDGIAPAALLDDVREAINTDPDTGLSRVPLGMTDDTLFVESITRTTLDVTITGLDAPAGTEATVQSRVESAIAEYLLDVQPWISGLDLDTEVNETVTAVSLGNAIQPVLEATGSFAEGVAIDGYDSYTVGEGELLKLGTVSWV